MFNIIPIDTSLLLTGERYELLRHYDKVIRGERYKARRRVTYYITDLGRVIKVTPRVSRVMTNTLSTHPCGYYYQVRLPDCTISVHREVGRAFHPDFNDNLLVCHKDETLQSTCINSLQNLFIGTNSDNIRDAYAKGRKTWSNQTYKHLNESHTHTD